MTTKGTDNRFRSLTVVGESGTPATPASGDFKLYVADDGTFYLMDDTGTPTAVGGGGGFSDPMTTRGDIIVRNASNVTARLAIGSAGKVLSSDGTDISWQTPSSGGALVLLEQHTASSSATLDFTSFISSTYDEYMIELVNVIPATNATGLFMRVGTGGGPTYDTGSNYLAGGYRQAPAGNAANVNCGGTSVGLDVSGTISNSSSGSGLSGTVMLYNGNAGTVKPNGYGHTSVFDGSTIVYSLFGWQYTQTTSLTALRFFQGSGNIASGTIRVYGVAK